MKSVKATEKSERGKKEKSERKKDRLKEKRPLQTHVGNGSIYNNFCCGKLSIRSRRLSLVLPPPVVLLSDAVRCVSHCYTRV